MDIQSVLVFLSLLVAVGFLIKKFFLKKKRKKNCGDDNCGCN